MGGLTTRRDFLGTVSVGSCLAAWSVGQAPRRLRAAESSSGEGDADLVGHWPLAVDTQDHSPLRHPTKAIDVELGHAGPHGQPQTAARFNGFSSLLEVPDHAALRFGSGEFTIAAWVHSDPREADVVGTLLSKFDPARRTGVQLDVLSTDGVTSTALASARQLSFGVDDGRPPAAWDDCGRPGNAVLVAALSVVQGNLYAGTLETGREERGHLWRYAGGRQWVDLGNPMGCNIVQSVVEFDGALYCGVGRYNCSGSVLGETLNTIPGGKVFRVAADGNWTECGHPGHEDATPEDGRVGAYASGKADDVMALTVYRGELYCVSNHRRNVFKYAGGRQWKNVGLDHRIITLKVYRGKLYALVNGGPVYRYEGGTEWVYCGTPEKATQLYGAVIHQGEMYVGTWPEGEVFRYQGGETWELVGRAGYEREVMAAVLYNGKAYFGSLPMANVWRLDGNRFTFVGNLDNSPVILRRVWSMAVYQGRLFAGTLPSGHVWSTEAGKLATWDRPFPGGWHHVAATRDRQQLTVYVDGKQVAASSPFAGTEYQVTNGRPLQIGDGTYEHFHGLMSDVRLYRRSLSASQVAKMAMK